MKNLSDTELLAIVEALAARDREAAAALSAALAQAKARGLPEAAALADETVAHAEDGLHDLTLTLPRPTFEKLLQVQAMMDDGDPASDVSAVLERALALLLERETGR